MRCARFLLLPLLLGTFPLRLHADYRDVVTQIKVAIRNGGLSDTLAVDPGNANHVLIGTEHGGMYRSDDAGAHWTFVQTFPAMRVAYILFCPTDSSIVVATSRYGSQTERWSGIWRSVDGGVHWSMPATSVPPLSPRCPDRIDANGISWVPGTDTVWVAGDCGLMRSDDRGATWRLIVVREPDPFVLTLRRDRLVTVAAWDSLHVVAGGVSGYYYMHDGRNWHRSEGADPTWYAPRGLTVSPGEPHYLFRADFSTKYLQYSRDQGVTWHRYPRLGLEADNMPPWVRTVPAPDDERAFELYFGDGTNLKRVVLPSLNFALWHLFAFETLTLEHSDTHDLAFHPLTNRPYLLVGDAGVMKTPDDGRSWQLIGAGPAGHNALEVFGVVVQHFATDAARTDLTFATWHNGTWTRQIDAAEWAGGIPPEARQVNAAGPELDAPADGLLSMKVQDSTTALYTDGTRTNVTADTPPYKSCDALHYDYVFFRNPSDNKQTILSSSYGCPDSNGVVYARHPANEKDWVEIASRNDGVFTRGTPQTAVRSGDVTLYQPFVDSKNHVVLNRVIHVNRAAALATAEMNGMGSLAVSPFNGGEAVWAVKPDDERVLFAVDETSARMMISITGGGDWAPLENLTDLISEGGLLQFMTLDESVGRVAQVTKIAFDPYQTSRVIVATMAAGLFESRDMGLSWRAIGGSKTIPYISSLAFDRDGTVYLGSSGRGLWKWSRRWLPTRHERRGFERLLIDVRTHKPFVGAFCDDCMLLVARRGTLRSIRSHTSDAIIVGATDPHDVLISGTAEVDVVRSSGGDSFRGCDACNGQPVRAMLVRNAQLLAVATADDQSWRAIAALLDDRPRRSLVPRITVESPETGKEEFAEVPGAAVTVSGYGFSPDSAVHILLNRFETRVVMPDVNGAFRANVNLNIEPGRAGVECVQTVDDQVVRAIRELQITNTERKECPNAHSLSPRDN
jgi:hypothetical protein